MEIVINGIKTNYQVFGQGEPFLILHGWGSASDRWITEAEVISEKNFKVIMPDLPGFGASEKLVNPWTINDYVKWLEEFTKALRLENFYLSGYSFGGALAAKMSVKYPQRVKKLFLIAAAIIRKRTSQKKFASKISKFIKLFNFFPHYQLFRKAIYKYIIRRSDYIYTEGTMKQTYLNVVSDDVSFNLPFIKVPTVIIWGDKDQSVPVADAYYINEKIKNSKLVIIPGADHLMHRQIPEILANSILNNI